jgi:K+/H+ antiporter YhaU regulatory subunit KhtT
MIEDIVVKPVYQQIAIDISNRIANGEFVVGEKIHGRSTLAGKYNVSPETVRRAMKLLEDMSIVEVHQGSGIVVKSKGEAYKFIEKFKDIDSMNSVKTDIYNILEDKTKLDQQLQQCIDKLIDYSERFKNTNPFAPIEVAISKECKLVGKTIREVNFWQNTGATIVGIRRGHSLVLSPGPYATFMEGDVFVMIGEESTFERVNSFLTE